MTCAILVNLSTCRVLKVTRTIQQAEYYAEMLCPFDNFIITGAEKRHWAKFTALELGILYKDLRGVEHPADEYSRVLTSVHAAIIELPIDDTPCEVLATRLGRPLRIALHGAKGLKPVAATGVSAPWAKATTPPVANVAPVAPRAESPVSVEPKREGVTKRVWIIAQELAPKHSDQKELRAAIIGACVAEGIHPSTAATQYSRWKASTK